MKAAVLYAPGDLRIVELPDPAPAPLEVVVKVEACGICGSDLPRVLATGTYTFPTIPGHEIAGQVVAVGSGVSSAWIDARVAVVPLIPCRRCAMCSVGEYAMCSDYNFLGSRSDGGFAQYATVPAANLVRLPGSMAWDEGALLEPIAVALHAYRNSAVTYGSNVVVYGLGPVGNLLAQWGLCFGADRVVGVEPNPWRRDLAASLGIEVVDPAAGPVSGQILEALGGRASFAFEASGFPGALPDLMEVMAPMGTIGLVGRPTGSIELEETFFERQLRQQVKVQGNWSFQFAEYPVHPWVTSARAVVDGRLSVSSLVTHRPTLSRLLDTICEMRAGDARVMKALVKPWSVDQGSAPAHH